MLFACCTRLGGISTASTSRRYAKNLGILISPQHKSICAQQTQSRNGTALESTTRIGFLSVLRTTGLLQLANHRESQGLSRQRVP